MGINAVLIWWWPEGNQTFQENRVFLIAKIWKWEMKENETTMGSCEDSMQKAKVVQNITSCYMWQLRLSFDVVSYRLFWAKLGLWRIQNSDKFRFIWRNTVNSIENEDMAGWEILLQTMTALESASSLSLLPSLSLLSLATAEIILKRKSYIKHI